jgi:hypothetical protein
VQVDFSASHFGSPFGSPARKQEDLQLLSHLVHSLQPHVWAAHFQHHSAGGRDSLVELVFRDDSASQAAMYSLVDTGVWDYQLAAGQAGSLPVTAVSKRLHSTLATVTIYRMPVDFMRQGAVATLLQAAGYTSVSVRAEHMGGLRLGRAGSHPTVGRGDVLVAYVVPPADDPHLSRLPRVFHDRDKQVDISVRAYDPRTNTSGGVLRVAAPSAGPPGPRPSPPPPPPSHLPAQPAQRPQPAPSSSQPSSPPPPAPAPQLSPATRQRPLPRHHGQRHSQRAHAGVPCASSAPPPAHPASSAPTPPSRPEPQQLPCSHAPEVMDTSPPAPPDCPLREAASLWLEDNVEALPHSSYEGVIGSVACTQSTTWAAHAGSTSCPPAIQRALGAAARTAMGQLAAHPPPRRSARLATQPAGRPPPYWSSAPASHAALGGRGQPWP